MARINNNYCYCNSALTKKIIIKKEGKDDNEKRIVEKLKIL